MSHKYNIEFKTKTNTTVFWIYNIDLFYDAFTWACEELPTSFLYDECVKAIIIDTTTNETVCEISWDFAWNLIKC